VYGGVQELADDLTEHGVGCEAKVVPYMDDPGRNQIDEGVCNINGDVVSIFVWSMPEKWAATQRRLDHMYTDQPWVIGPNWGVEPNNYNTAEAIRDALGGSVRAATPSPALATPSPTPTAAMEQ
jgi:hypothetical protein